MSKVLKTQFGQSKLMIVLPANVLFFVSYVNGELSYPLTSTNKKTRTPPFQRFLSFSISDLLSSVVH